MVRKRNPAINMDLDGDRLRFDNDFTTKENLYIFVRKYRAMVLQTIALKRELRRLRKEHTKALSELSTLRSLTDPHNVILQKRIQAMAEGR